MKWKGDKLRKTINTLDGYLLKVAYIEESKYWWAVYKDELLIASSTEKKEYKKSIYAAQKTAQQRMIKHLHKDI